MLVPSYPKVYALGHRAIVDLLKDDVVVQEKYDGSQISWLWRDGNLLVRSRGKMQYGSHEETDSLFEGAIEYLKTLTPVEGLTFRGEWFASAKHNTLAYGRRPKNGIVLFDVEEGEQGFVAPAKVSQFADAMGLEEVHTFLVGNHVTREVILELLDTTSSLSGPLVEGIVIKNYNRFAPDGKALMGKFVSEKFKEKHDKEWKANKVSHKDIVQIIIESLNTEARWEKAIQHLKERGEYDGSPRDIGPLMKEVKKDTIEEEKEWIAEKLLGWALPNVTRSLGRGLPEWYKEKLMEDQFE
jgi:hypothetical protein